jgi:hypothetical protein
MRNECYKSDRPYARLVTDYGAENPLLMDYYGFSEEVNGLSIVIKLVLIISQLYQVTFKSRGDSTVSQQVVSALNAVCSSSSSSIPSESSFRQALTHGPAQSLSDADRMEEVSPGQDSIMEYSCPLSSCSGKNATFQLSKSPLTAVWIPKRSGHWEKQWSHCGSSSKLHSVVNSS